MTRPDRPEGFNDERDGPTPEEMQPMTLLERLEAATEGSRELDVLLWAWERNYKPFTENNIVMATCADPPHDTVKLGTIDPGKQSNNFQEAWADPPFPNYTTSIDAALALVERVLPDWNKGMYEQDDGSWFVEFRRGYRTSYDKVQGILRARTLPLGICIALVKAENQ